MKTRHTCILGDARNMAEVATASVHLVVTSPPYWQLKDYGSADQIGFNDSYEDYINNLNLVWSECHRVLHPGCRMVVNIGDQFARAVYYGRYKVIPIRTEIIKFCETIGFDYLGAIIWQKKTTMNTTGGATVMGSFPYPRNGIVEIDYEFVLIFKKPGQAPKVSQEIKEQSRIPKEKWKEYFSGHWYFGGAKQEQHLAMFPVELPKRAIEMFTFVGETVLDPFLGSGTTSLAAMMTHRNSIGYEINPDFLPIIKKRLSAEQQTLFGEGTLQLVEQERRLVDWQEKIEEQPYVFRDPAGFDKRTQPSAEFGSKVGSADADRRREAYFTVRQVLSPNTIRLNNEETVRLIGVKPKAETYEAALAFLRKKILKRPVFLRFEEPRYDRENRLRAYVYLKNKTFVNAHLLKHGLVDLDPEFAFKYERKFEKLVADQRKEIPSSDTA